MHDMPKDRAESSAGAMMTIVKNFSMVLGLLLIAHASAFSASAPVVQTTAANPITSYAVTINGTVNPKGAVTNAYFQFGLTTAYGSSSPQVNYGSGTLTVSAYTVISGLPLNTTYHYRIVATNSVGTSFGGDLTFTTPASQTPPAVQTSAATQIAYNSASLNGTVNPNNAATTAYFQYGLSTAYGSTTSPVNYSNGITAQSTAASISGLSAQTTYHFRIVATNSGGTSNGSDLTFVTTQGPLAAPTLTIPANGSTGTILAPAFSWSAVSGATSYRIMVASNAADLPADPSATTGGPSVVINATPASNSYTPTLHLNAGTTYYWSVRTRTSVDAGAWSSAFSFSTAPIGRWTALTNPAPGAVGLMLLLSDGTVITAPSGTTTKNWYRLTPDINGSYVNGTWSAISPMIDTRLWYSSEVVPDGRVFVAGGEYGTGASKAEIYDPLLNQWTQINPPAGSLNSTGFYDSVSKVIANGSVLVSPVGPATAGGTLIYNPAANAWTAGPKLFRGSYQDEATWVKLPDDSILTIDPFGTHSERYIPSLNTWVDDGVVPVSLYDSIAFELGAAFLLPNGKVFYLGATGHTAIYTPSNSTSPGAWSAGPDIPLDSSGTQLVAADAPAAMMRNGRILCAFSPKIVKSNTFPSPSSYYEYDYTVGATGAFTQVDGPFGGLTLNIPSYSSTMLDLPDGSVLYTAFGNQLYTYQPYGAPLDAGKPAINSTSQNGDGTWHLTGTNLNGIGEGACYGDDAQMNTNYPLVRLTDNSTGNVYYARTFNWSSTGVMTGSNLLSTEFSVPAAVPYGTYSLVVVANGNSSDPISFTKAPPSGSLQVTITPADAAGAGAAWQVDGGAAQNSGATVANLSVGSHTVTFSAVSGYATPANQNAIIADKTTTLATGTYNANVPSLNTINPASVTVGGAGFTMTLDGSNFIGTSTVKWGGQPDLFPASVTSTQITISVPSAYIASLGQANISVANPAPGGGTSAAQVLTVGNPVPGLSGISPAATTAGTSDFTLTLNGSGFVSSSVLNWQRQADLTPLTQTPTQLTVGVPAGYIANAGVPNITVSNPAPGGGAAIAISFTINPAPSLSPATLPPGATGNPYIQTITASGGTGAITMAVNNYSDGGTGLQAPATGAGTVTFNSTPATTGTVSFDLTATDAVNAVVANHYAFAVNQAPSVDAGPADNVYQGLEAGQLFGSASPVSPASSIVGVAWTCIGAPGALPADVQTNIAALNALIAGVNSSLTLTFASGTLPVGDYTLQLSATDDLGSVGSAATVVRVYSYSEQHLTGLAVTRTPGAPVLPPATQIVVSAQAATGSGGPFADVIGIEYRFSYSVNGGASIVNNDWSLNAQSVFSNTPAGYYQFYVEARIGETTAANTFPDGQPPEISAYAPDLAIGISESVTSVAISNIVPATPAIPATTFSISSIQTANVPVYYNVSKSLNGGPFTSVSNWQWQLVTASSSGTFSAVVTDLAPVNGVYIYRVQASMISGTPQATASNTTAITVGPGVSAVAVGAVTVAGGTISFPINATVSGNPTVFYHIARSFNGGAYAVLNGWNWQAGTGTSIVFSDATATANGIYSYQVEASSNATGPYTAYVFSPNITVGATVTAVSIGAISVDGSTVSFPINATVNGAATVYYHVARRYNGGAYTVLSAWNWTAGTGTSIAFRDSATPDGVYSYQVEASSSPTGPYTAFYYTPNITVAPAVTAISAGIVTVSGGVISFPITTTTSGAGNVYYHIARSFNGGAYIVLDGWNWASGAKSIAFNDATATANGIYVYQVEASNSATGPYQAYTFTPNISIGPSVTALSVGTATVLKSTVSFPINVTVSGPGTVYYHVAKSINGGSYTVVNGWNWLAGTGTSAAFSDTTATVNGTNLYQVEASNSPTGPYTAYAFKSVVVSGN